MIAGVSWTEGLVDFDARTGHNHGTKFRLHQDTLPTMTVWSLSSDSLAAQRCNVASV